MFSPYAAMGNSPGMMIDPNGELTKDAQPVQDNGMDYAGLDAIAVRAFMDGVMSGLYNINFMFGSNTMVMASGGGSAGVQDVGQVWLPKYTDNMNMCNVFRAALSDVPSDIIGIKGFTIAPDNSIYVTYYYVTGSSRPSEDGEDGGTERVILEYGFSERTTKFSLPPRGDLQKQQSNGEGLIGKVNEVFGYGTFLPGTAFSLVEDVKYFRWASMGGLKFTYAPFSVQKDLILEARWAGKYVKIGGNVLGATGLFFTGMDMIDNGFTPSNTTDGVMGGLSFVPGVGWVIGGIYFIGNTYLIETTGKSFGDHFNNWGVEQQQMNKSRKNSTSWHVCFEGGTLVYTKDGMKVIESVQVGDSVYSYDFDNQEIELNVVV